MTIEFRSQDLVMTFRQPGSDETTEKISEVRWCPLTGRTMRITARRPLLSSEKLRAPEDLPAEVIDNVDCGLGHRSAHGVKLWGGHEVAREGRKRACWPDA